jgi:hypothetical protein
MRSFSYAPKYEYVKSLSNWKLKGTVYMKPKTYFIFAALTYKIYDVLKCEYNSKKDRI